MLLRESVPFILLQDLATLRRTVETLQSAVTRSTVNSVLDMVRQLASRPTALVDPYALTATLEQLTDVARETNHPERKKFEAVFKQCRPLVQEPRLATVVIQLLGDKEEEQIHKLLKSSASPPSFSGPYPSPGQFPRRYSASSGPFSSNSQALGGRRRSSSRGKCYH